MAILHSASFAAISPFAVLALNDFLDSRIHSSAGDWLALAYFTLYGVYCAQNFLRCREFHCAITGPGFLLAALLMAFRIGGVFDRGFGIPYIVFFVAAVVGHVLESRRLKHNKAKS